MMIEGVKKRRSSLFYGNGARA